MKITVEVVPTEIFGGSNMIKKSEIFLNGEFEGIIGYFGKLEFETNTTENEVMIKSLRRKINFKFTATEDVYIWFEDRYFTNDDNYKAIYYRGKDITVNEIREEKPGLFYKKVDIWNS